MVTIDWPDPPHTPPRKMAALSGFQRDILTTIADLETPAQGSAIHSYLQDTLGREQGKTRTYDNIRALVDVGLVQNTEPDKETYHAYRLTDVGERLLFSYGYWVSDLVERSESEPELPAQ